MRLLLVEDEKPLGEFLRKGLRENGYSVDWATDGEDAAALGKTESYDAIVLDVLLPKQSGFQVPRELRAASIQTPVIVLTAKGGVNDRVTGLDLGPDDYLGKPFAFAELLARLRALQRRPQGMLPTELRCADLVMNIEDRSVMRGARKISLTPKEFSLLEFLLRRQGRVVTRTAIIESVWDMNFDSFSNVVDVMVNRVRTKIDVPFDSRLIQTVRGVGYVLRDPDETS